MQTYEWAMLGLKLTWALFCFAYGACVGSLTNVIVYRMPLGQSIVTPPSRCPKCQTRLSWKDNIPVLGWLALKGRCRYCKNPISAEYPIVEAVVGLLFVLFYLVCYVLPPHARLLGVDWGAIRPQWFANEAAHTWPTFVVLLVLVGSLVAATLVDAKTSTIPLPIVWTPTALAVVAHTGHAVLAERRGWHLHAVQGWSWAIPSPGAEGWSWIGLALGGTLGLGVAMALLSTRLITRSFADYQQWEEQALQHGSAAHAATDAAAKEATSASAPEPADASAPGADRPEDLWIMYPHARREMVKELAFLCPIVLGAIAGYKLVPGWAGSALAPLWLQVLAGVLLGYLIGGGIVWAVRIVGSLAFGKEAMGLGDVHLMAAVGACLGWIDATVAFFAAAFVGLGWVILGAVFGGSLRRAMPYGPYLAVATILVFLAKPLVETALAALTRQPIHLP